MASCHFEAPLEFERQNTAKLGRAGLPSTADRGARESIFAAANSALLRAGMSPGLDLDSYVDAREGWPAVLGSGEDANAVFLRVWQGCLHLCEPHYRVVVARCSHHIYIVG
jgi:hypothetical protein